MQSKQRKIEVESKPLTKPIVAFGIETTFYLYKNSYQREKPYKNILQ
jgi:hypothetical protein